MQSLITEVHQSDDRPPNDPVIFHAIPGFAGNISLSQSDSADEIYNQRVDLLDWEHRLPGQCVWIFDLDL